MEASDLVRVPGFSAYGVSLDGEVWSFRRQAQRAYFVVSTPQARIYGYPVGDGRYRQVRLVDDLGRARQRQLHIVILETLVGPCPDGQETRHLDGDSTNNHPSNLAWGTPLENAADKVRHGTIPIGEQCRRSVLTDEIVREAYRLRATGLSYSTIGSRLQVSPKTISSALLYGWRHIAKEFQSA